MCAGKQRGNLPPKQGVLQVDVLYIVIPAYNEAVNLKSLLDDWYPVIQRHDGSGASRLVVINDGSSDNTYELLCGFAQDRPLLQPLTKPNGGHGPTVLYGYRYALEQGADYVFQTDSDGQTSPAEFEAFWQKRTQYHAIFGNRTLRGDGWARALVEKVLCLLLRLFFGVSLPDANAPFRLMQAGYLQKYLPKMPQNYNLPNAMLTAFGRYYGEPIAFLPISFKPRQGGVNSINLKKIFQIGRQSLADFSAIRKGL